jgi:hypothetical protein
MNAKRHLATPPGEFYLLNVSEEGGSPRCHVRVTVQAYIASQPFEFSSVETRKAELVKRDGRRVVNVLAEIAARRPSDPVPTDVNDEPAAAPTPQPSRARWETLPQPLTRTLPSGDGSAWPDRRSPHP